MPFIFCDSSAWHLGIAFWCPNELFEKIVECKIAQLLCKKQKKDLGADQSCVLLHWFCLWYQWDKRVSYKWNCEFSDKDNKRRVAQQIYNLENSWILTERSMRFQIICCMRAAQVFLKLAIFNSCCFFAVTLFCGRFSCDKIYPQEKKSREQPRFPETFLRNKIFTAIEMPGRNKGERNQQQLALFPWGLELQELKTCW